MNEQDKQLIEGIESGGIQESKSISKLIALNKQKILSFVKRHKGSHTEAEDILLEGITELVFNVRKKKFLGKGSLNAYLYQICRLLWYQKYRTKKIESNNETFDEKHISESARIEFSEEKSTLDLVLDSLGEACKKVLVLWSRGFNMTEIQQSMDYSSPQVAMNKKSNCIKKLTDLIAKKPALKNLLLDLL